MGQLETKVALAYDLAATVFQLSFLFLIFLLKKMDLDNVFMALSLGCIPTILFGLVKHPEVFAPHAAIKDLFAHNYYKYVKPNLMFFVVGFSSNQFNNFAIFLFLGSSNLANCEAVRLIVIPLHITILAMGSILIPYFSKNLSMYGREEAIKKFKHVFSFSLVLFCIFALFVLIMGPISLTLFYGIKYQSQFILLVIYTFVYVFDGLNTILISFLKSLGLINEGLRWRFVVAIVNLILVFPLLHLFKEAGGLFSMMISSAVMVILYFNILRTKKLA
ncbi:MAG: polysaccharide biosynthesis C-terminal domain-containing protein [bacterium]|nr:polysaccharide biosynthesis C-terminal domain-containing protein [bacterium]